MSPDPAARVRVAAVNDYDVIVAGVAALLGAHSDQLVVAERIVVGEPITEPVDVALYDTYGRVGSVESALGELVSNPEIAHVAVFSLHFAPAAMERARALGVTGFIWKGLPGDAIADAVARVGRGDEVLALSDGEVAESVGDWPGRAAGLTERQSEVLALVATGLSNREVAEVLFLSPETVKDYVHQAFRKIGVRNRVEAANYVHGEQAFRHLDPRLHG
jgi:DNA-binding NarL/FixJ family response regulator